MDTYKWIHSTRQNKITKQTNKPSFKNKKIDQIKKKSTLRELCMYGRKEREREKDKEK
jgi:hypothetical protein